MLFELFVEIKSRNEMPKWGDGKISKNWKEWLLCIFGYTYLILSQTLKNLRKIKPHSHNPKKIEYQMVKR